MKRLIVMAMMMLPLVAMANAADDERIIAPAKLPAKVTDYINTHVPSCSIVQATKGLELSGTEYKVWLSEGYKLEFKGNRVKDIEGNTKLPDTVIPAKILQHVTSNYANLYIVEWQLEDDGGIRQEVKLNNGLELVYSAAGDFLRIDN